MKNILKSTLVLLCGLALTTACSDDNNSNPTLTAPTEFKLNTPSVAAQEIDLANSGDIEITCSQPNYGFPARTIYTVQVSNRDDMSNMIELKATSDQAAFTIPASTLASTLTSLVLNDPTDPKTESDFPMTIPVYIRLRANMVDVSGKNVEGMEILSNTIKLESVRLLFSLPPVTVPEQLYVSGNFNETGLPMVQVYDGANIFWHMVYIDGDGVILSQQSTFDEAVGFNEIKAMGDLGADIKAGPEIGSTTRIASANPGWYLMIVTTSVTGRKINYDVQFNKPEVWLIGVLMGGWDEFMGDPFEIVGDGPTAEFVSSAFELSVPGDDEGGCVRAYVKIPGFDWWKSEFMVFDDVIVYRGMGGDQERVAGNVGQRLHLYFYNDKGEIK